MIVLGLGVVGAMHGGELTRLQPAQKKILAILMAAGPEGLGADRFADEVWQDTLPNDWESAVRQAIARMRRAIGLNTIVNTTRHYALGPEAEVDVWRLLQAAELSLDEFSDDELVELISGEPYVGVEPTPILRSSIEATIAARVGLVARLRESPDRATTRVLEAARNFLALTPYREDVLACVVRLHLVAGLDAQAMHLLDYGIAMLEGELGHPVGAELTALQGATGATEAAPNGVGDLIAPPARWVGNLDLTQRTDGVERVDLMRAARSTLGSGGLILTGESGSGKTELARRLALDAMRDSAHIVWLTASRDQRAAYGPVLAALPWLLDEIRPLLREKADPYERAACWTACIAAICSGLPGRTISMYVDDAQWLDSPSQAFVEYLAQARSAYDIELTVIGRQAESGSGWANLRTSLTRTGLATVEVPDFTQEELVDLIGRVDQSATSKQRLDLATALVESRAALPAIVSEILNTTEPAALISVDGIELTPGLALDRDVWTQGASPAAKEVASAAAVAGMTFRVDTVAALTERTSREVLAAIDELLDAQLLRTEQRPDEFSFGHILIHEAFESLLDRATRRELHLRAAQHGVDQDPHRRASHLYAAGALVEPATLSDALVTSAVAHHHVGSFREAAQAFARAFEVDPAAESVEGLLSYANALDLSGADGWTIRRRAFESAQAAGDHDLSVGVAIDRAHETEDLDGDDRRVSLLEEVELTQLGDRARQSHRLALARELSFVGDHDRARELSRRAIAEAADPDERCAGWLASWPSHMVTPVSEWPAMPEDRSLVADPILRARMLQVECVRALTSGDDSTARSLLVRCAAPALIRSPLRGWFASLLQAMVAFSDGDWVRSNEIADAGLAAAQRAGISSAFSARAAQAFSQEWILGRHGALLPLMEAAAPDVQESMLAEAAHTVALATHPGRRDQARDNAEQLARTAVHSKTPLSLSVGALLASSGLHGESPLLARLLVDLVTPFSGTVLIVGTGVTNLGPATRTLSMLAGSVAEREELLVRAIDESDRWNLRLWSVRCRLDLNDLTGDARLWADARELAAGTDLATALFSE